MMASREQSRIEAYLESNKIGPLFEEMMTRLISETPDQPVPFLITHLQGKKGSPVLLKNVLLGSAALWAQTPAHSKVVRWDLNGHEKSWQEHPRRPKKSKSDLEVCNLSPPSPDSKSVLRSAEHPCWDSRTRPESNDFDELSHILQESKKLGKALESLSHSMAAVDEFYQEPISYNTPPPRPRVIGQWAGREESDADPLAAEMLHPPLPRQKSEDSSPSGRLKVEPKRWGLKQQQERHKKQLAALLSQENSSAGLDPSAVELDIEDEDDAMELMEDLEDLRMEGVTSLAPCRNKVIQVHGSHSSQPQAKLTLNICSRCARFQGDGVAGIRGDSREEKPQTTQEVPEVPGSTSEVKTSLKEGSENEHPPQVTGENPSASGLKLTAVRDWSTISQNQQKEPQGLGRYASANRGEELTKMTEDSSEINPNSPLSSLLLSPLVLQSLSLPDQPSKPTSSLSLPSNKPTSLLLGPPQAFSNKPIAPLGSSMLNPATSSRHSNMEKSPGAFSQKSRAVTPTSHAGWNIPFTSGWNRPVTPTHQPDYTLHTIQASLSGWSRTNTSTNQIGWSMSTMPNEQPGKSRSLTPTEQAGWSRSITLSSQGRRSVPATPTDTCGWSRIITPTSQGRRSRPITPTDQPGRSRSVTPTDLYGWNKPITPTSQGRRSRPITPTDTAGLSRPVTPTDLYGWSKPITPTSQGRRSRPVTPTDTVGLSRPVTPTSQGRRSRPVTPTETVGLSRPVTPTSQGRRSRPVTPTEMVGLSRPVTPTSQGRRSRPVTPTDSTGWSRPVTPTDQAGWSRPITPTSHGRRSRPVTPTDQTGRSRSVTPTNQAGRSKPGTPTDHAGRHLLTPTTLSSELLWPTINQTSVLSEAEFYQQLQAMRQPWLLPSDTDSENGVADGGPA